jgi:hypothetical protein
MATEKKTSAGKAKDGKDKDDLGKLAAKLAKTETDAAALAVLEKAGDAAKLLEQLLRGGKLTLAAEGPVRLLVNWSHHLPADAVVAWLEGLADTADEWSTSLPGLGWPLHDVVRGSYRKEPDAWKAALGRFSGRKRDAVLLAMGHAGEAVPEADRARMIEELVPHAFSGNAAEPTAVAAALGLSGRAWGERTLPALSKSKDADPWQFLDAAALSPFALAQRMVLGARPCQWNTERLVMSLLEKRDDAPEELVGLAQKLLADGRTDDKDKRDSLVEAIGALALERAHRAGREAPAGVEALLNGRHYEHAWRNERIVAFASAIPAPRLHAFLEAQMDDFSFQLVEYGKKSGNGHLSAGLLRVHFDEGLARRWVAKTCESLERSTERLRREAIALGQAGPAVLAPVLDELARRPRGDKALGRPRDGLRLASAWIAAELARTGRPIPPELDELFSGDDELRQYEDGFLDRKVMGPILEKLPQDRGERVVRSWLAMESAGVNKALAQVVPPPLRSLVVEETLAERVVRLAKATGLACDTRIYALLPVPSEIEDDDEIEKLAGVVNRAGAVPEGLTADRIPKVKNKPMKHVLTFDLDAMPEVKGRMGAAGARAMALFVSPQKNNRSGEPFNDDMVYVPLSEAEAAEGPQGGGGRAFTIVPVDVPAAAFTEADGPELADLRRAIFALPGRALGKPNLLQDGGEESLDSMDGDFVMQLDERIAPMNLGDGGLLYLYRTTAFWQCH